MIAVNMADKHTLEVFKHGRYLVSLTTDTKLPYKVLIPNKEQIPYGHDYWYYTHDNKQYKSCLTNNYITCFPVRKLLRGKFKVKRVIKQLSIFDLGVDL